MIQEYENNVRIAAEEIHIGKGVTFGCNVDISIKGVFSIGSYSHIGNNTHIRGNNVHIDEHFYCSGGLRVGGGGAMNPTANLFIGKRCVMHNNFINLCERVTILDDVGLSPEANILTHGYWQSVLEGYPAKFAPVTIKSNVIVGYRSLIMPNVTIEEGCVIGAQSVVSKDISEKGIYAGSPAKRVGDIKPLTATQKENLLIEVLDEYTKIAPYHNVTTSIRLEYPWIVMGGLHMNVETFDYVGHENEDTDDFRDFLRKFGIRIYTHRPFKSKFTFE
jgi:acetyltransferase-like isoleucine patch superfamily enzyme